MDDVTTPLLIVFIISLVLIVPWLIGHAVFYLWHIFTDNPMETGFWIKWIVGMAISIIGSAFKGGSSN